MSDQSQTPQPTLREKFPGGLFIGFNAVIDRKATEQLVMYCNDARPNFDELTLAISSPGGNIDQAIYLYNILRALPIKITTFNLGGVHSAAILLYLAGDVRLSVEGGTFLFHQTSNDVPIGQRMTDPFFSARAKSVRLDDERTAGMIAERAGATVPQVRKWQNDEYTMTAAVAAKKGVVTGVRPFDIPAHALFHQLII